MSDLRFLEQEKISKLLIKFAIPSIVGLLAHAFYNVCDRIIVGQGVGTEALSGVTVVFPTIMVRFAFTILVGAGSATIMSIYLGEKKKKQAEKVLTNGFFLSLFLGAIFCFIGVFY
jgi:Na+-driven multidrug efflux pump